MEKNILRGQVTRSSLGRLGLIGELYDVRTETFSSRSLLKSTLPKSCIQSHEMGRMELDFKLIENISDRFELLNIEAELQLNIMLGLINIEGSGKFLTEEKKSEKTVSCSLICKLQSVSEKLFASFEEILPHIDLNSLSDPQYTHVIVEVTWGANCLLSLESTCDSSCDRQNIEGGLTGELVKLKNVLSAKSSGELKKEDFTALNNQNIHIKVCADVIPENGWPTTVEGFSQFVSDLPKMIKNMNNGKGKPLNYVMLPLSTLRDFAKLQLDIEVIDRKIDQSFIISTVFLFEEIIREKQKFHDVLEKMKANKKYVSDEIINKTEEQYKNLTIIESQLKSIFSEDWFLVKSGKKNLKDLLLRLEKFKNHHLKLMSYEDYLDSCEPILNKIAMIKNYISKGITYLGRGDELKIFMADNLSFELVVLFTSSKIEKDDPSHCQNTSFYFLALASEPETNTKYVVVDLDLNPSNKFFNDEITSPRIYHLKEGKILSSNLFQDHIEEMAKNYAKLKQGLKTTYVSHKPGNRVVLEVRCPGFEVGSCTSDPVKWSCFRCKDFLEYGFDECFYCLCGKNPSSAFEYRCSDIKHGVSFIRFYPEVLTKILSTLRPLKELNLIVLGQSGVGKSTWINSIVNYLTYDSLDSAKKNGVICTIPISILRHNPKTSETHVVNVGEVSKNEVTEAGASATQCSHTYSFFWEDRRVRIIDTPGIGDVRGIAQDKENFKNIIDHIGHLTEVHAMCILFKANDNRIIAYFKYCLKELLVNFHRSALKNIVFCFTNARNSLYEPGATFAILKKLIEEMGLAQELALGHHNMFCLDNEAFLFLCVSQNPNFNYDEIIVESFSHSWDISLQETKRLFETIKNFEPHNLRETISLVTVRNRILALSKPLAEISKTIQLNLAALKRKQDELLRSEQNIKKLSETLTYTEIHLETEPLCLPRTVCTNRSCVEYIYLKSLNVSQVEYKTHCHVECYLKNVLPKTINNADLKNCEAMLNGICKNCKCGWEKHMHLTTSQKRVEKTVVNENVKEDMLNEEEQKKNKETKVNNLKTTIEKYKKEEKFITETCVKFGFFLRMNSITLYNDSVEEHLKYVIYEEENKLHRSEEEEELLKTLKDFLDHYKSEVNILNEVIQRGGNLETTTKDELTTKNMMDLEKKLYDLELTGEDIKKSVEATRLGNEKMMNYSETFMRVNPKKTTKAKNSGGFCQKLNPLRFFK